MSWVSKFWKGDGDRPDDESSESAAPAAADGRGPVLSSLRQHLVTTSESGERKLDFDDLRDDVDLYEAGYVDSLTASRFLMLAEKQYGVKLPDWLIGGKANTLESLARYIETELGKAGSGE